MTTAITVKQGDYGVDAIISITVTDPDGIITTLSGKTLRLLVWEDGKQSNPVLDVACVFDSLMTCHYVPAIGDLLLPPGLSYRWELELDGTSRLSSVDAAFIVKPSPIH